MSRNRPGRRRSSSGTWRSPEAFAAATVARGPCAGLRTGGAAAGRAAFDEAAPRGTAGPVSVRAGALDVPAGSEGTWSHRCTRPGGEATRASIMASAAPAPAPTAHEDGGRSRPPVRRPDARSGVGPGGSAGIFGATCPARARESACPESIRSRTRSNGGGRSGVQERLRATSWRSRSTERRSKAQGSQVARWDSTHSRSSTASSPSTSATTWLEASAHGVVTPTWCMSRSAAPPAWRPAGPPRPLLVPDPSIALPPVPDPAGSSHPARPPGPPPWPRRSGARGTGAAGRCPGPSHRHVPSNPP